MLIADYIAVIAVVVTVGTFGFRAWKETRIMKFNMYQNLEFASNELFRFEAENHAKIDPFMSMNAPDTEPTMTRSVINNYLYQTLNLFEIAAAYRAEKLIEPAVYGSWVIWYYNTLNSWYFRQSWEEIRINYTPTLRNIFDDPVSRFDFQFDEEDRRQRFFEHVAKLMKCEDVGSWLTNCNTRQALKT